MLLLNHKRRWDSWPRGEFNLGPETRCDRSELLCNEVSLKYKRDRESFRHRHQKGQKEWPPVINTRGSLGVIRMGAGLGTPGTFSPGCLESPTPKTYASAGSLSSRVVLCRLTWSRGRLRGLRAIPLEVPLLSTAIASPSLFTRSLWAFFSGCLRTVFIATVKVSACSFVFLCLSFFSSYSLP